MPASVSRPPAVWPWFLLLLLSLGVIGGIVWDVGPLATSLGLRVRSPVAAPRPSLTPLPPELRRIRLFYPETASQLFREVERDVSRGATMRDEVQTLLTALSGTETGEEPAPVPPQVKLRHVFLDSFGILTLDLSGEFRAVLARPHPQAELAAAAVVNSLIGSFTDVKRVQLLVEGQELPILAGSLDLGRPLSVHYPTPEPAPVAEPATE